jgi:hypothetical protein
VFVDGDNVVQLAVGTSLLGQVTATRRWPVSVDEAGQVSAILEGDGSGDRWPPAGRQP